MKANFESTAPPFVRSDEARNLVEFTCFRFLSRCNADFHPSLKVCVSFSRVKLDNTFIPFFLPLIDYTMTLFPDFVWIWEVPWSNFIFTPLSEFIYLVWVSLRLFHYVAPLKATLKRKHVCLQDTAFRRLTFSAMLAWQRPYKEDIPETGTVHNGLPVSVEFDLFRLHLQVFLFELTCDL